MSNLKMLRLTPLIALFLIKGCAPSNSDHDSGDRPNILFAIMDDATYMHMSAYGCDWVNTPNFDRVARDGILFKNAYTNNAKCSPSRSIILTGRHSWQLEEAANHWPYFPAKFKVFTEVLDEAGYAVGSTGKGWGPGVAKQEDGSPRNLMINTFNEIKTEAPTTKISSVDYAANFDAFLAQRDDRPFFFWYGGFEPHRAYEYGAGIEKGGKRLEMIADDEVFDFWPADDSIKTDLLDYAYEIEYFDEQLGKMLAKLEAEGELDNTMVVVTSDNGMPFPRIKAQAYDYSNHLPLAIMWPNSMEEKGRVVEDFVSFLDLAPTFLEVTGIEAGSSGMASITGSSFADILTSDRAGMINASRNRVLIGKERHDIGRPNDGGYPIRGMIKGEMLYIYNFENQRWPGGNPETGYLATDGSPTKTVLLNGLMRPDRFDYWQQNFGLRPTEELYHLRDDPSCLQNLILLEGYETVAASLQKELFDILKAQGDPRMLGQGEVFDEYAYSDQGGVNFYERYFAGEDVNFGWVNATDFQSIERVEQAIEQYGSSAR